MDSLLPSTREKAVPAAAGSGAPGATRLAARTYTPGCDQAMTRH